MDGKKGEGGGAVQNEVDRIQEIGSDCDNCDVCHRVLTVERRHTVATGLRGVWLQF